MEIEIIPPNTGTGRRRGAPTLYPQTDEGVEQLIDLVLRCGSEGMTLAEIAVAVGVRKPTIYEWKKRYPEFSDAMDHARDLSEAWWDRVERQGFVDGTSAKVNAALLKLIRRNRFPETFVERAIEHRGKVELVLRRVS